MKTILYMGITVNGQIAREDGDVKWNSGAGWQSFYDHGKSAGNYIMGANTYTIGLRDAEFPYGDGVLNIVMTNQKFENKWGDRVIFTDKSPKEVLDFVEQKGFQTALLVGGGKLNASFAKEKLIDEIYLDVESVAFGKGIPVFTNEDFDMALRFSESRMLSPNTIQLHYQVIK